MQSILWYVLAVIVLFIGVFVTTETVHEMLGGALAGSSLAIAWYSGIYDERRNHTCSSTSVATGPPPDDTDD